MLSLRLPSLSQEVERILSSHKPQSQPPPPLVAPENPRQASSPSLEPDRTSAVQPVSKPVEGADETNELKLRKG